MGSWIGFIALRYFKTHRKEKGLTSSVLAVLGIALGVMTLTAVLGIMNGFQLGFIENILEISSAHLRIESPEGLELTSGQEDALRSIGGVKALYPFFDSQTLIKSSFSQSRGAMVRGVGLDLLQIDPGFAARAQIVDGEWNLEGSQKIIMGTEMAMTMGVEVGDRVSLMALSGRQFSILRPQELSFEVVGLFKSGYYDFDVNWSFISMESAQNFVSGSGDLVYGVKLVDHFQDERVWNEMRALLQGTSFEVQSWREYNKSFFGALRMEKVIMMILIGLIFLMVGVNIFHSQSRSIKERYEDIGLLKALGASPGALRLVFILEGFLVGSLGGFFGSLAGLAVTVNINEIFDLVEKVVNFFVGGGFFLYSGGIFYMDNIPARVLFEEMIMVLFFALGSSSLASWVASRRVTEIRPALVLRSE